MNLIAGLKLAAAGLLMAAGTQAGGLHYESSVVTPCSGKTAYETVTYTFPRTVTDAYAFATQIPPTGPDSLVDSYAVKKPGRTFTLRIPFTYGSPLGVYAGWVAGFAGKRKLLSPMFPFTVTEAGFCGQKA